MSLVALLPGWHCTSRHREKFWQAFPIQGFRASSCVQVSCRRWEMLVWTNRRHSGKGWEKEGTGHYHVTPVSPPTQGPDLQRSQSQRVQLYLGGMLWENELPPKRPSRAVPQSLGRDSGLFICYQVLKLTWKVHEVTKCISILTRSRRFCILDPATVFSCSIQRWARKRLHKALQCFSCRSRRAQARSQGEGSGPDD